MTLKSRKSRNLFIAALIVVSLIAGIMTGYKYYTYIFRPNVTTPGNKPVLIFIPHNSSFNGVVDTLEKNGLLKDSKSFIWVAKQKKYPERVVPGCYSVNDRMTNNELVNLLRSGIQTPVKVTFNNIRTLPQLAGKIAKRIEPDSVQLLYLMTDSSVISDYGFDKATFISMFIPNTYEFYWTTSAKGFLDRMHKEYENFWDGQRIAKAKSIGMTPVQVSTLASIVDEETARNDEKPVVAGLYINRLKKGIRLQADPTVKFAIGDFTVKRILNKDLKTDSPYNTYLYKGLPPGPVRIPSIQGIDAVLNYQKHNYLYMCAKEDFSGYHNFSTTLKQHNIYAAKYRRALQEKKIWR